MFILAIVLFFAFVVIFLLKYFFFEPRWGTFTSRCVAGILMYFVVCVLIWIKIFYLGNNYEMLTITTYHADGTIDKTFIGEYKDLSVEENMVHFTDRNGNRYDISFAGNIEVQHMNEDH